MLESIVLRILKTALGSGDYISSLNPLPVIETPGGKASGGILTEATIAAATITALADCTGLDLGGCPRQLCLTVEALYNGAATQGIRVHVISSYGDSTGGAHTGGMGVALLTDADNHFPIINDLVGLTVVNETDGSEGVITANTLNTVTAVFAGGAANVWNTGDTYYITGAGYDSEDYDTWAPGFAAGTFIRQTKPYSADPRTFKVLIENLDPAQTVTFVTAAFTYQM